MGELDGKVAVITGTGSGMGRAAARTFVREGARVLVADISGRRVQQTADELGDAAVPFRGDVSVEAEVVAMFAAAVEAFGRVDAVLNVAGIGHKGRFADVPLAEYERIVAVNMTGVLLGTQHAIRTMVPTGGGAIVNWASGAGLGASYGLGIYGASKAGVISLTKSAAVEHGAEGIRANVICPGLIETEMSGGPGSGVHYPDLVEWTALKRAGQPEEVAEVASFLASDRASYVTGAVVPVDAGSSARVA
jgi:NAD(P)-dependent dehydrogenase (short-subunit alcohol dehydrogenase family)